MSHPAIEPMKAGQKLEKGDEGNWYAVRADGVPLITRLHGFTQDTPLFEKLADHHVLEGEIEVIARIYPERISAADE